ncbi:MAG TPA: RES family NAD+ phosphorylase [Candidatus Saccharimonadales bacterium]|nr:RES family NAD+ phosphorylase [Candidatus Saccharimonadales bacterium]
MSPLPSTSFIRRSATHRLIPSKYSDHGDSVLTWIADDSSQLADIFDLDNATNDRLLAENELLPAIGIDELVSRIPCASIINAAFTHAHPLGSRFNGPDRGAWYAAFEVETSQAEVAFHKSVDLAEIGRFEDEVTYDDYLADFRADFNDLRGNQAFSEYLNPDSYVESQGLAERLLASGSLGIIYPSVRRPQKTCIVCFRPALVTNVRKGETYRFVWNGSPTPTITMES